ncbi:MAG: hypothetical protein IKH31_00450 [Clostridia bacterium]|nr:hypothetical protein [Clostridia bacterium]
MKFRLEDHDTYFPVYNPMLDEVKEYLDKTGNPYEVLIARDIPEDQPQFARIENHYFKEGMSCIKSHMNVEDMQLLVHKINRPIKYGSVEE